MRREVNLKGEPIMLLPDKLIKYYGKAYNSCLNDQEQVKQVDAQAKIELKKAEKTSRQIKGMDVSTYVTTNTNVYHILHLSIYNVSETTGSRQTSLQI